MSDPDTPPTCPRCGSDAVIPDAHLSDRGDANGRNLGEVGLYRKPDAMMLKGEELVPLRAQVCGDCGFVEFYAADPRRLWSAYLDRLQRIWERGPGGS